MEENTIHDLSHGLFILLGSWSAYTPGDNYTDRASTNACRLGYRVR